MKKLEAKKVLQKKRSLGGREAIITLILFGIAGFVTFYQNQEVYSANWSIAQAQTEAEVAIPKAKQDGTLVEIATVSRP